MIVTATAIQEVLHIHRNLHIDRVGAEGLVGVIKVVGGTTQLGETIETKDGSGGEKTARRENKIEIENQEIGKGKEKEVERGEGMEVEKESEKEA